METLMDKVQRAKLALRRELLARARSRPIKSRTVLYQSNSGQGAVCNPEALFRALLKAPDQQDLRHVWVLDSFEDNPRIVSEFRNDRRVEFVKYQSFRYFQLLATSGYLINNATFPPEFSKRPGQTYVNTWHGTPLKLMGYDVPKGGPDTRNIIRNFVQADFILSPNSFTTDQMFRHAYRLDGIYRGAIVEEGYPRIDRQLLSPSERDDILTDLKASGVEARPDEKIILIAPTWKGSSYYEPENDARTLARLTEQLQSRVRQSGWRVLLKVHPRVYRNAIELPELSERLIPDEIPTNRILGIADALVTDYSSIFYDFEATHRPTIFYIPDQEAYAGYRGLYESPDQWPGPVVSSIGALADSVNAIGSNSDTDPLVTHGDSIRQAREKYNLHDDGHASDRVIDIVFRRREESYNVRRDFSTKKTTLLIYAGGLLPNGISTSVLNLLDSLDHNRFDVSVTYPYSKNSNAVAVADRINPNVRLFPRIGQLLAPRTRDHLRGKADFPWGNSVLSPGATQVFDHEWRRCFGDSVFDHIIDFSGYSPQWAGILAAGPAKTHTIWQHNDLAAEAVKRIGDRQPHAKSLPQVFELYNRYDSVVSVSRALSAVNQKNLQRIAPTARFRFARNTINAEHVLQSAEPDARLACGPIGSTGQLDLSTATLEKAVRRIIDVFGTSRVTQEVSRATLVEQHIPPQPDVTTFITIGRMSPEKNQARLLEAFKDLQVSDPNTRLVLVGSGQLESELKSYASALGITDSVVFTGQVSNPYPLLAAADCFVLSSDYEGQPMVILEALTLGLPIVTTGFDSVADALPEGAGLIVDRDAEALTLGLQAFLRGRVASSEFDAEAYNRRALQEFLSAIGAD